MTRVVIVGEIYNADLSIGGGPIYPGGPGAPVDPGYGRPELGPRRSRLGRRTPRMSAAARSILGHPANRPPGSWDGSHVDNELPGALPQGGTEVPPEVLPPPPVPEEIASQYIVSVYNPKTMTWTTKSYPPR